MKSIFKSIILFAVVLSTAWIYVSCSDDELANGGEPRIRYVRITKPTASDSLLVGAFQNNLVAIVGDNLEDAKEIWFNDQPALLSPVYITKTSILVTVPSKIPGEITNKMTIVFGNGKTLEHPFVVEISEPVLDNMKSEFVNEGHVALIRGDFFYEPLKVTFTGGVEGEVLEVAADAKSIEVIVPAGAAPGPITVTTNFGEGTSNFWFHDNRNIFISSDPFTGWWNADFVVMNPGEGDPEKINGNYIRVNRAIGAWSWVEVAGGPPSAMGDISKNIPSEAILHPEDYNLKFEVNTLKPYNGNVIKITAGLKNDFNNDEFRWFPPYDTKGEWQTVVIPFETVAASYGGGLQVSDAGYYTRLLFHGPGALDADISFDNFRIVPKVYEVE